MSAALPLDTVAPLSSPPNDTSSKPPLDSTVALPMPPVDTI